MSLLDSKACSGSVLLRIKAKVPTVASQAPHDMHPDASLTDLQPLSILLPLLQSHWLFAHHVYFCFGTYSSPRYLHGQQSPPLRVCSTVRTVRSTLTNSFIIFKSSNQTVFAQLSWTWGGHWHVLWLIKSRVPLCPSLPGIVLVHTSCPRVVIIASSSLHNNKYIIY